MFGFLVVERKRLLKVLVYDFISLFLFLREEISRTRGARPGLAPAGIDIILNIF